MHDVVFDVVIPIKITSRPKNMFVHKKASTSEHSGISSILNSLLTLYNNIMFKNRQEITSTALSYILGSGWGINIVKT